MNSPTLLPVREVAPDTKGLRTFIELPGLGYLAINAFYISATEPVIIDTGMPALADDFVREVAELVALDDLRWIYLTHADPDHTGALWQLLERAPRARVVTTFLGYGKLNLMRPLSPERVFLLNPGQRLQVGDRSLRALPPLTFDAPETTAVLDEKTGVLFSADSFGALLPSPADEAAAVHPDTLRDGLVTWTTVDAPWLHAVREDAFASTLAAVRAIDPSVVLSTHLPPAEGMLETLLGHVNAARSAAPFVGPDQEAMMRATMAS